MAWDAGVFFALWLRKPMELAAASPSGRFVAAEMGRHLELARPGAVLELGGGTGGVTRGLLQAGCPPERLVVLEREPDLVAILRKRFPGVLVLQGDAAELGDLFRSAGINSLASVASSLPIKWFPVDIKRAIVDQSLALLGPGGAFLQMTNAFTSPLPMAELALEGKEVGCVWLNFLPAQIWRYHRSC